MNTITLRRVSQAGYTTRFLTWLAHLPLRLASAFINLLHRLLAAVLPARRTALRIVFYQIFILGWVLAAMFAHQTYNVRCGYNYQVHGGWFMTKQECDDQYQAWAQQTNMYASNQDILK